MVNLSSRCCRIPNQTLVFTFQFSLHLQFILDISVSLRLIPELFAYFILCWLAGGRAAPKFLEHGIGAALCVSTQPSLSVAVPAGGEFLFAVRCVDPPVASKA
jgi:hypothetical protein